MKIIRNQVLVVCTKDRPEELIRLLKSVSESDAAPLFLVIVDSSTQKRLDTCAFKDLGFRGNQLHYLTTSAGLPMQRQVAINYIESLMRSEEIEIVNFLDDDITIPDNYFSICKQLFEKYATTIGFGAYDMNMAKARNKTIRGKFENFLGLRGGNVLINGIASVPKNISNLRAVRWFPGHSMSFRINVLLKTGFNPMPQMYGEDLETCLRLEPSGKLSVHPEFYTYHWPSTLGRDNKAEAISYTLGFTWRLANEKLAKISRFAVIASWLVLACLDLIRLGRAQSRGAYLIGLWLFVSKLMQSKDLEKLVEPKNFTLTPRSIQIFKH